MDKKESPKKASSKSSASSSSSRASTLPAVPDYILVHIAYVAVAVMGAAPIAAVAALAIVYVLSSRASKGSAVHSHCVWVLRSVIVAIIAAIVLGIFGSGFWLLHPAAGGVFVIPGLLVAIWVVARIVFGWIALFEGKAIKNPKSWSFKANR